MHLIKPFILFSRSLLNYFFIAFIGLCISACASSPPVSQHTSLESANLWSYGHDPYGSSAEVGDNLIQDGAARIIFNRAARSASDKNTWVELIYHAPKGNLANIKSVRINYQCSTELIMKFSQRDYGESGDGSYAHYQTLLPAANDWKTIEVALDEFSRPAWTPSDSKNVGLIMENVTAIYLAPALDDIEGGVAALNVRAIELVE
jgi:plasmid maintenance system killer protein